MQKTLTDGAGDSMIFAAKLVSSERITPTTSREEVRRMVFRTDNRYFDCKVGSCIRVLAPGQYGNPYHTRLYSIADADQFGDGAQFEICVRRCFYIDEASGEEYGGVASTYLCDLKPGSDIKFSGPVASNGTAIGEVAAGTTGLVVCGGAMAVLFVRANCRCCSCQ